MANRLADETSPYLLQHANNPVDWYPWGEEALGTARERNRPIFLSIGYAACHWCHVMERESFEDEATAAIMNEHFINIKVDREERPDLDSIYMAAVTALTGRGGWPMSVWLTPDGEPFFGGTYFPDSPRHGMSSFTQVLEAMAGVWQNRPDEVAAAAAKLADRLRGDAVMPALSLSQLSGPADSYRDSLDPETVSNATEGLARGFDASNGGWGHAPKFPQPMVIEFLLRRYVRGGDETARLLVERSLDHMAAGGIYDHVGGGFHRYSVDEIWLVPHFEKMLYDNSQLARVYLHAWQVLGTERYREVVEETLDYVLREMTHPDGGFFSTQDADSEGEEGRFFVWTPAELEAELGADAALFMKAYGVEPGGNFEGSSILYRRMGAEELARLDGGEVASVRESLARSRASLLVARDRRVRPARDEKILAAWNGLMIAAFAEAGVALSRPDYLEAAARAAGFVLERLRDPDGRLLRSWKDGRARLNGYLEDHTHMILGLLALYQATFEEAWVDTARELADTMLASFAAPGSGFYDTRSDHESLIVRPQDFQDNAVPSGNGMAATVLLDLAALTGDRRYAGAAEAALAAMAPVLTSYPLAFGQWLTAFDTVTGPRGEVAIVGAAEGPDTLALLEVVREAFRPGWLVAVGMEREPEGGTEGIAILAERTMVGGRATAYVCRDFTCSAPVNDPEALREALI